MVYTKSKALGAMQRKTVSLLVALLMLSAVPLNVSADENDDIPTNASATGVHNSLVAALAHADLVTTLQGDGPFTVFAPTDDAFAAAGINLSDFNDDEMNSTLTTILLYHVYAGEVLAADVTDGLTVNMINGLPATFGVANGEVTVGDAKVTTADVMSSNGVIHVIDTVLMPSEWQILAVEGMSMFDTDGDSMVTWDEFDAYIATDGGWGSDEEKSTSQSNFNVSDTNGDMMLDLNELVTFAELENPEMPDIPTIASETGIHDSLVAAVVQAGLLETLQSDGPFTVFAPTDEAFTNAGIDLNDFSSDEAIATLADILLYHVVSGEVTSDMLSDGMTATMANGDDVSFTVNSDGVMVNDATVTVADVEASNGVIHVIDTVLMPPEEPSSPDITEVASGTGVHTSLVAAIVQAGLLETLQGDGPYTVFAPTDEAFTNAGVDLADFEGDDGVAALANILAYHVAMGVVTSDALSDGMSVTMLNQETTTITIDSNGVMVNDATVTAADVMASNGVIHVIDTVLMPEVGPEGEICYNMITHTIVPGADKSSCESYMYVEDYEVQGQSITGCYNMITHQVTDVSPEVCGGYMWTAAVNLVTTASATTIHSSLVAALSLADLATTLQGDGPYTVFAPTDEAFASAGIDLNDFSSEEEIATLADILLYHVVAAEIMSSDLNPGMTTVVAANGDDLMVHVTDSGVMIGSEMAMVTLADVPASNGVIHVIDKVLMPPAEQVDDNETSDVNCDLTIGISSDGYAFSPASVTIDVGQTVCWKWTDESMAHNVKEVDGMKSDTFVDGGVSSGEASTTVDFYHTFTEDTTFYYACEPHISVDMFGKITVGDGGYDSSSDDEDDDSDNNTPGFLGITMILATLGAVAFARSNRDEE